MCFLQDHENKIRERQSNARKLNLPAEGSGLGELAMEGLTMHAIPWLGKKAVEMGRFGVSELMRNKNMQKKAVSFAMDKASPYIQNVGSQMLDSLSTKIRPNKKYKTDRKDLDGAGFDIHSVIGKLPRPKAGWTPGKYKYMGPYNPLEKQLDYDPETGEVLKWYVKPFNKVDEIAAHHDICYGMASAGKRIKGDCDRKMVKQLDSIPYGEMPKWGQTARFLINTKKKLGLGATKHGKRS